MTSHSAAVQSRRPLLLTAAIVVSLVAAVVNITSAFLDLEVLRYSRWLYVIPLMVALVANPVGRRWRGLLWLAGMFFSMVGDTQGGRGFVVLLGSFLIAHLFYIAALLPDRKRSLIGHTGSVVYAAILVVALVILVPEVDGALVVPVMVYALVLGFMALLAAAGGPVGVAGGLLFMISDLVLGIGIFAVDLPEALQRLIVIGTYVPAQVLLLIAFLRLAEGRSGWRGTGLQRSSAP